ncbi:MAG: Tat pathway signal sequence domain protein [Streptomyces sp.]|uniref:Tat pathway signal sequence domain protein n=1 Tax=Streptomyces sp. TaxID=1931 RepID=UPI0025F92947|nr:Tat pathway signal sequence domain protein [Streptomyces sp.]MBW8799889.1 Tat pathway signal sequence domain protein [Streptomyces sp.]
MSGTPTRRDVLRYTGAVGTAGAAAGVTWLAETGTAAADTTQTAPPDDKHPASPYAAGRAAPAPLDSITLGNDASEAAHGLVPTLSSVVASGGLGQSARILNPATPAAYEGGTVAFTLACAPTGTTYVTIKLWGDDYDGSATETDVGTHLWRLQLFCEGLQVGYQDQGEVDNLDIIDTAPRAPGRFFFHTLPLPEHLTVGKTSVSLEIRALGRIWSYGQNAAQLYRPMTTPSRGIYRLYSHTDPFFVPPAGDVQGPAPTPSIRTSPGPEALAAVRARVVKDTETLLTTADPHTLGGWSMQHLAESYFWPDCSGYQQASTIERALEAIDGRYWAWKADSAVLTASDQQWQGFGRVGLVLALLWEHLASGLDAAVTGSPYSLANPGFELGSGATATGWSVPGWSANGTATRDTTYGRSGTYSMKLVRNASGTQAIAVDNHTKVSLDQGTYTYGVWVKGQDVTGAGVYLDVLFYDAAGKVVGTDNKCYSPTGTFDWRYQSLTLATPANAVSAWLFIGVKDGGTAWIDDVTVVAPAGGAHTPPTRRAAYTDMLVSSRDYWRQHFPHYSNQVQICAIGIYQCNRALRLLGSGLDLPEAAARNYLYQAVGLVPYLGPEDAAGNPAKPLGDSYHQVTAAGLTRELGYVGSYGEVTDWLIMMYESLTRGAAPQDDPVLKAQIIKMVKARGHFHSFDVDAAGARIARVETVIGWRNEVYPGIPDYAQRTVWDSHPLQAAVVLQDPDIIGWTQEMMADGQFHPQLDLLISYPWDRVGLNAFRLIARDWDAFQALPPQPGRLPTGWDAPDFVVADEENGAVAVKHGRELLYASLYWRARQGINNYARVHHLTETDQRSATIRQRTYGATTTAFAVQDWILWDYAINDPAAAAIPPGGFPPPGPPLHQSLAGDLYYKAPIPADVPDPTLGVHFPGVETMLVGNAPFYLCRYGDFLIAMNTTADRSFTLPPRPDFGPARDLVSGRCYTPHEQPVLGPRTTIVLVR